MPEVAVAEPIMLLFLRVLAALVAAARVVLEEVLAAQAALLILVVAEVGVLLAQAAQAALA
jgi:hypothetical protein